MTFPSNLPPLARYAHIDALRAIAVLIVVVSHSGLGFIVPGSTGVTIFFTISGFIITTLLMKERKDSGQFRIGRFYLKRAFKIMPPFLLIITLPTLAYALFAPVKWSEFLAQIFFVFNFYYMHGLGQGVLPGSGPVWSLAIEEQFYIVFAIYWLLAVHHQHWWRNTAIACILIVIGSGTARFLYWSQGVQDIRILYGTETRADSIVVGVIAALLFERRAAFPRLMAALGKDRVLFVAGVLFLFSMLLRSTFYKETLRLLVESLGAAVLILYGLVREPAAFGNLLARFAGWRPIQVIGLASYSIYLVHLVLIKLLNPLLGEWPLLLRVGVFSLLGVLAGVAIWRWVEVPVLALRHRLLKEIA